VTFAHSKDSRVLVNERHVSGSLTGWTVTHRRAMGTTTSLLDDGYKAVPGLMSGSLALRGLLDGTNGDLYAETVAQLGVDNGLLVTALPHGGTIGRPAFIAVSDLEGLNVPANTGDAVSLTIEAAPDDGVDLGVSLHALGAETADGNAASVDQAASTSNGGVGSLHVTAYTGLTQAVIKIQHSEDDSVWADLITFTTVTAATSQRSTASGTVNRYVRSTIDVTGTGSTTYAVAFARR
jgi:hypothetical protein